MKKSNRLLMLLGTLLLCGLYLTDRILVHEYALIDLNDKYKNFEKLSVSPFRALNIQGGNGYAVHVLQGRQVSVRVAKSRKSFFRLSEAGNTLTIKFTVANQRYQPPEQCAVGLIIEVPDLQMLYLSGTNNEIGPFAQDQLDIRQDRNTVTRLKSVAINSLKLTSTGVSSIDFRENNTVKDLTLNGKNQSVFVLEQVVFQQLNPYLQDSSRVVLNQKTLAMSRDAHR